MRITRNAEIVIHAAAIVGVGRVCHHPRETLETNFSRDLQNPEVSGERNSRLGRFRILFDQRSLRRELLPGSRRMLLRLSGLQRRPVGAYAIAKLAGEHLVQAYYRQCGIARSHGAAV